MMLSVAPGHVFGALIALAVAPGVAAGGGPWAIGEEPAPGPVSPLSLARGGSLLAGRADCGQASCTTVLATRAPGGAAQRAGHLRGVLRASVPLRGGRALVVTGPLSQRGLVASDVSAAGVVTRTHGLTRRVARALSAASDRRGVSAIGWLTGAPTRRLLLRVRRRDGDGFWPARALATFAREGDLGGMTVAVGPRGEIAVLWASGGALRARLLRPGSDRFGPVLRVGRSDTVAQIAAVFTTGGALMTVWRSADGGEEQNRIAIVRAAVLRRGVEGFSPAHRLGAGAGPCEGLIPAPCAIVRAIATGDTAVLAWTSHALRVRVATAHGSGAVTAIRGLDTPGVLADAAGAGGRGVIAWTHDPLGPAFEARAALVGPGPRVEPAAPVGPAGSWATGTAVDEAGTRAVVTWGAGDPVIAPRWGVAEHPAP